MKLTIKKLLNSISLYKESPNYRKNYYNCIDTIFDTDSNRIYLDSLTQNKNIKRIDVLQKYSPELVIYSSVNDSIYYFVDEKLEIIAMMVGYKLISFNSLSGVSINLSKKHPSYKNLGQFIYTNYLLNKFDFIESDSTHNDGGKILWKKLLLLAIQNHKKAVVYSKDDGEFYQFFKTYDVNDNFDSFYPDNNSVFRIYK